MAEEEAAAPAHRPAHRSTLVLRWAVALVALAVIIGGGLYAYAYTQSPAAIRQPAHDHFHFRTQIIVGGRAVDFADANYQTPLGTDVCSAAITKQPFHFHDNQDQFTHVHWAHMTGGLFLKNYGWNFIDGLPNQLGYKFVNPLKFSAVNIHGHNLPKPPAGARYFIFTGDPSGYREASWSNFLHQDLRKFFSIKGHPIANHAEDARLLKLNDVIGSVVIFVQADRPGPAQVTERFKQLQPLPESSCAG